MFIIAEYGSINHFGTDYFIGKMYTVRGEKYPCTAYSKDKAKVYMSKARAERACDKLNSNTGRNFTVIDA
ncbi:hypothetical protein SAMN02745975_00546 [Geosporobacter subterraneus DSM 17957]|uniref:Uncharacterized protein n=1 Tax=Geosporobacter subterraneus DSM 17957 TaxID=1121919 RepID=A0A1M6DR52_9FIRM|nr:hypothetical protein [Geosporobacter subterraneus]SHI75734.1 hypothetical protein SAMN02745975_00546 [Geosporobacter subterraneus DSM 17957]